MGIDLSIFQAIFSLAHRSILLDWLGIFFAVVLPYLLAIIFLIVVFRQTKDFRRRAYYLFFTGIALIISYGLISRLFHYFYPRPRPFAELGLKPLFVPGSENAFPSDHTIVLFTLVFTLVFFARAKNSWLLASSVAKEASSLKRATLWFAIGSVIVVAARVFSGVHWPLDILGGILIAFLSVLVANWLLPVTR